MWQTGSVCTGMATSSRPGTRPQAPPTICAVSDFCQSPLTGVRSRLKFERGGRMLFRDRADAGRQLLSKLGAYRGRPDVLVFGLPRGGLPVAYEVARGL